MINDEAEAPPTSVEALRIGFALSGGGVRAMVFHFGLLGYFASLGVLHRTRYLSTVSGGSLGIGLIYALNGNRWPTSDEFLRHVQPAARRLLTETNLQQDLIRRTITRPWYLFQSRAPLLAESLRDVWQVGAMLSDMPHPPEWVLHATAYQSGKDWKFTRDATGDYRLGKRKIAISVADAMAASSAYPILIGPLELRWASGAKNDRYVGEVLHLWDGGLYDNQGLEHLFSSAETIGKKYNFFVVSDASTGLGLESKRDPYHRLLRLVSIGLDQVRGTKARLLIRHFLRNQGSGLYLQMGNFAEQIFTEAKTPRTEWEPALPRFLSKQDIATAPEVGTTLRNLSEPEWNYLYRHGWEVAQATLYAYGPTWFRGALPSLSDATSIPMPV